jgi:uncharacterized membrane protein
MATISESIDIAAAADEVWALLADVRRLPEYSASTTAVRDAPQRLTAVGDRYVQVGRLLGVTLTSTWTVTVLEPGRVLVSEGRLAPGVRYRLAQRLEALPGGATRLGIDIDYAVPGGALGRFAARAGAEARATVEARAVLEGIRATVEAAHRSTPSAGSGTSDAPS